MSDMTLLPTGGSFGGEAGAAAIGGGIGGLIGSWIGNNHRGFGGWGGGDCGPVVLNGGGDWGGRGRCEEIWEATTLNNIREGVSATLATVPTNALQTQAVLGSEIARLALGTAQAFSDTKDSVQNGNFFLSNQINNGFSANAVNLLEGLCGVKQAVVCDGEKTRGMLYARFLQEDGVRIAEQNARIVALETRCEHDRRHAETTLQISNNNTAVASQNQGQFQAQQQQQMQQLMAGFNTILPVLHSLVQVAHATNSNIIAGNTGAVATGPQTANPVNVKG